MKKSVLTSSLRVIIRRLEIGCGNHGCVIAQPQGIATNGECQCTPDHIRRALRDLAGETVGRRWQE
jgi:hypothetical protein